MNNLVGRWVALSAIVLIIGLLIFFFFVNCKKEKGVDGRTYLSSYVFSRAVANDVSAIKDNSMIHGPTYFYFKSSKKDIVRLVEWLQLHHQKGLPELFLPSVAYVRKQVDWAFDWDGLEVFATYYCGGNIVDWGFDMLLVDGSSRVIYVTSGYISDLSRPTRDFQFCGDQ